MLFCLFVCFSYAIFKSPSICCLYPPISFSAFLLIVLLLPRLRFSSQLLSGLQERNGSTLLHNLMLPSCGMLRSSATPTNTCSELLKYLKAHIHAIWPRIEAIPSRDFCPKSQSSVSASCHQSCDFFLEGSMLCPQNQCRKL